MTQPPGSRMELPGLREQIDQAAVRNFPIPDLVLKRIEVTVPGIEVETRLKSIIRSAEELGGTAMRGLDRGGDKVVLAAVPKQSVADFEAAADGGKLARQKAASGSELIDCEVVIHPDRK